MLIFQIVTADVFGSPQNPWYKMQLVFKTAVMLSFVLFFLFFSCFLTIASTESTVPSAAPFPFSVLEMLSVPAGLDPAGVVAEPMHPILETFYFRIWHRSSLKTWTQILCSLPLNVTCYLINGWDHSRSVAVGCDPSIASTQPCLT